MRDYWRTRPRAPTPGTVLGPLAEIEEGAAREYVFGVGVSAFRMFVVRCRDEEIYAYLNLCPHFSLPLNRGDGDFLCPAKTWLRCNQHFALFRIQDGRCVTGSAAGEGLEPIPVEIEGGIIRIATE